MSAHETNSSDSRAEHPIDGGVLAALPRTRPQRASPRRAATRAKAGKTQAKADKSEVVASAGEQKKTRKSSKAAPPPARAGQSKTKPTAKAAKAKASPTKLAEQPGGRAPNQGYEPEEEVELGKTINPPSGVDLVESVADIFGELANSSVAAGGRILKDAFSLLRRP